MGIIGQLFNKSTYISLTWEEQDFVLHCYYGDEPAIFSKILDKWPELAKLAPYIHNRYSSNSVVPIDEFDTVREILHKMKETGIHQRKLNCYIPVEVERIEILSSAPEDFEIHYVHEGKTLFRRLSHKVTELRSGWIRRDDQYWHYKQIDNNLLTKFRKDEISSKDWLSFARDELPIYRSAGVKINSDVEYMQKQAFVLNLDAFDVDRIMLEPIWNIDLTTIDESIYWDGYIFACGIIYPGITPATVSTYIANINSVCDLSHSEIAYFLDHAYPVLKSWMHGDLNGFEKIHRWIEPPFYWELEANAKNNGAVGKSYAYPIACVGNERLGYETLVQVMQNRYTRISEGWVRKNDLLTLGIDEDGTTSDGKVLKPIRIDADTLLHCGDARLGERWSAMHINGLAWNIGGDKHTCAEKHLEYLLHWGMNGGVFGGYEYMVAYGIPAILRLAQRDRNCQILIVGSNMAVQGLTADFNFLNKIMEVRELRIMTYAEIAHNDAIRSKRRDLIVMIEPDAEITDAGKQYVKAVSGMNAGCKIGFFCNRNGDYAWNSQILGYKPEKKTIDYMLRDCCEKCELPKPYIFKQHPCTITKEKKSEVSIDIDKQNCGVEIVLPGKEKAGVAIPKADHVEPVAFIGNIQVDDHNENFFAQARKLVHCTQTTAEHIPFSCYWPKYSDMSDKQKEWYFYLRNEIRNGRTPDTDLSYLLIYCYEIINQIGLCDTADGYTKLCVLLDAYGDKYPTLQSNLCDWLFDYIHVFFSDVTVDKLVERLPRLSERVINAHLSQMSATDKFCVCLQELESLTEYRITSSKFCQNGNQKLVNDVVPNVLRHINEQLVKEGGKGILNTYAPLKLHTETINAFANALTESPKKYTLHIRHYHQGKRICAYLKNVVRYTENSLRVRKKFSSRLQGIELDEKTKGIIDAFVDQVFVVAEVPQVPLSRSIRLDMDRLEQLRTDSDEIRETLIASVAGDESNISSNDIPALKRPDNTPEGMLTDLDQVNIVLKRLKPVQQRILNVLQKNHWKAELNVVRAELPNILPEGYVDQINEISISILGSMLIERESEDFIVAEDYRDELEYLMPKQEKNEHWSVVFDGLDEEWSSFFSQVDIEALGLLLEGMQVFQAYAKERGVMADIMIDEINALSSDTIGDLIVDENGICEYYSDIVSGHMKKEG